MNNGIALHILQCSVKLQTRQPALSCQLVVFHPGFFRLSRPEVPAGGSTANSPPLQWRGHRTSSCSNLLVPPSLAMRAHYPPPPPPPSPGPLQLLFLSEQRAILILLLLRP